MLLRSSWQVEESTTSVIGHSLDRFAVVEIATVLRQSEDIPGSRVPSA